MKEPKINFKKKLKQMTSKNYKKKKKKQLIIMLWLLGDRTLSLIMSLD